MNKKLLLAYKILLPVFILMIGALIVFMLYAGQLHQTDGEQDLSQGLAFILMFLINAIPMLVMAILGAVTLIVAIFVIALKNRLPATIASLVFLCLLAPFAVWEVFMCFGMDFFVELPILAVVVLCLNIANIVISAILIRQGKRAANSPHPQREEQDGQLPPGYSY